MDKVIRKGFYPYHSSIDNNDSPYNLRLNEFCWIDTSGGAITVALPSSADNGDKITIMDKKGTFATNNVTVTKDSAHTIMGADESFVFDVNNTSVDMIFYDNDWRLK